MSDCTKKAENEKFILKICQDEDYMNPRKDWDCFGHMICWHSRYDLGDDHNYSEPRNFIEELVNELCDTDELAEQKYSQYKIVENEDECWDILDENDNEFDCNYNTKEDAEEYLVDQKYFYVENLSDDELYELIKEKILILPLYLYDHSGITMNTTGFSCPWDSGQVGWIYVTNEEIIKEYGSLDIEKARKFLVSEVETYDQYLTGDVYGYQLIEKDEDGDELDVIESCWGFYGLEHLESALKSELGKQYDDLVDNLEWA